jgi:hypothetical protein
MLAVAVVDQKAMLAVLVALAVVVLVLTTIHPAVQAQQTLAVAAEQGAIAVVEATAAQVALVLLLFLF